MFFSIGKRPVWLIANFLYIRTNKPTKWLAGFLVRVAVTRIKIVHQKNKQEGTDGTTFVHAYGASASA
jgi:hypothetical protein